MMILIISLVLLIPSVFGYISTKINYDLLTYLPKEIDTMKGQDILKEDFGTGAFSMLVSENMKPKEVSALKEKCPAESKRKLKNFTGEYNCSKIVQGNNNFPPTPQEVADYCRSRGFKDPEGFADMFLEYCTNSGWRRGNGQGDPITNWKNYIVTAWEARNKFKTFPKREPAVKQIPFHILFNDI